MWKTLVYAICTRSIPVYCNPKNTLYLFLLGVPGPPGVIRVEEIGNTWVKLLWTEGANHNSPILYYTIQTRHYWALNEDDWRNASTCKYRLCTSRGRHSPCNIR